jgi:hypothetical protein
MGNTSYYLLAVLALIAAFGCGFGVASLRRRSVSRLTPPDLPGNVDLAREKLRLEIADLQASPGRAKSANQLAIVGVAASSLTALSIAFAGLWINSAIQNQANRAQDATYYNQLLAQLYNTKAAAVRSGAVYGLARYLEPQEVDDRSQATTAILLRRLKEDTDEGVYGEIVKQLSSVRSAAAVQNVFQQTLAFQHTLPQLIGELAQREQEIEDGCKARSKWVTRTTAYGEARTEYYDYLQDIQVSNPNVQTDPPAAMWVDRFLPEMPMAIPTPPPNTVACNLRYDISQLPFNDPDLKRNTTLHEGTVNGYVGSASILGNLAGKHRHVFDGSDVSWITIFLPDQEMAPSFAHAHLIGLTIVGNANGADFTGSALCYADLFNASIAHTSFVNADLSKVVFSTSGVLGALSTSPHAFDDTDWSRAIFVSSLHADSSMSVRGADRSDPYWKSVVKLIPPSKPLPSYCA